MKSRWLFLLPVLFFSLHLSAAPRWVEEFGGVTPYDPKIYFTGFGQEEKTDQGALEAAKLRAADDLIRKVKVEIRSDLVLSTSDFAGRTGSRLEMVTNSVSSLRLEGIEYLIERSPTAWYALAYIAKENISEIYLQRAREALGRIEAGLETGNAAFNRGDAAFAYDAAVRLLPLFDELVDARGVYRVAAGSDLPETVFGNVIQSAGDIAPALASLYDRIAELSGSDAANVPDALRRISQMLKDQGLSASKLTVAPLLYQSTDFSSQFGQYLGLRLRDEIATRLPPSPAEIAVRGRYWIRDTDIEISVSAQGVPDGRNMGSAWVVFPRESVPVTYSLEPSNYDAALKDMLQLADGALTDGGLGLEAWTNRGRHADTLVFASGEDVELYLRANQPTFVQLTYALATGEKVLLEERFYIGVDKVNRVVKYPHVFGVVPPYGVERLIISAFSSEPPRPNVVLRFIDGEKYQVFDSAAAAVSAARGLQRKHAADGGMRTAETVLTLTTVPELVE